MGTESFFPIDTVLTRKKAKGDEFDKLRVCGGGKSVIVESLVGFSGAQELPVERLREEYDAETPEGVKFDAYKQPDNPGAGLSPEETFKVAEDKGKTRAPFKKETAAKKEKPADESA